MTLEIIGSLIVAFVMGYGVAVIHIVMGYFDKYKKGN